MGFLLFRANHSIQEIMHGVSSCLHSAFIILAILLCSNYSYNPVFHPYSHCTDRREQLKLISYEVSCSLSSDAIYLSTSYPGLCNYLYTITTSLSHEFSPPTPHNPISSFYRSFPVQYNDPPYQNGTILGLSSMCTHLPQLSQLHHSIQSLCSLFHSLTSFHFYLQMISIPISINILPSLFSANAAHACNCTYYMENAQPEIDKYCMIFFGTSIFCYPFNDPCTPKQGYPSYVCMSPTPSPALSPTIPECLCTHYLGDAMPGNAEYCMLVHGASRFCFPAEESCRKQSDLSTNSCINTQATYKPTKSPSPFVPKPCYCNTYLSGAVPSETESYCYQMLGNSMICYPYSNICPIRSSMPTTKCIPIKLTESPTINTPTRKPSPTTRPTTSYPTISDAPTPANSLSLAPTSSPSQDSTIKQGGSPITGIIISIVIIFILYGGYQYAMESKKKQQQEQQPIQDEQNPLAEPQQMDQRQMAPI